MSSLRFKNAIKSGAATASSNRFQELLTLSEDLYAMGILFALGFSTLLLCPLSCSSLVGRKREDIFGPKLLLIIPYICRANEMSLDPSQIIRQLGHSISKNSQILIKFKDNQRTLLTGSCGFHRNLLVVPTFTNIFLQ